MRLQRSVRDFLYPPLCMHCGQVPEDSDSPLCAACQAELRLLDPLEHCPSCFCLMEDTRRPTRCPDCRQGLNPVDRAAVALQYQGPAGTMVRRLKYGNRCYLASGMAAYLLAQWSQLDWPKPDVVIPVPMHWLRQFMRGYNQSSLLASSFANMLGVRMIPALTRCLGAAPQAGQTRKQRRQLPEGLFSLRRGQLLADKTVLIIDDVRTTGSTVMRCAQALQAAGPREIHSLCFAQA